MVSEREAFGLVAIHETRGAERHCETCICGRRAPVQGVYRRDVKTVPNGKPPGTIAWEEHLEVWAAYAAQYGNDQSPERIAQRAGFGYAEIISLVGHEPRTWQPR